MTLAEALSKACIENYDHEVAEWARVTDVRAAAEQSRNRTDRRVQAAIAEWPIVADLLRVNPFDETTWSVVDRLSRADILAIKDRLPRWFDYKYWGQYSEVVGRIMRTRVLLSERRKKGEKNGIISNYEDDEDSAGMEMIQRELDNY